MDHNHKSFEQPTIMDATGQRLFACVPLTSDGFIIVKDRTDAPAPEIKPRRVILFVRVFFILLILFSLSSIKISPLFCLISRASYRKQIVA